MFLHACFAGPVLSSTHASFVHTVHASRGLSLAWLAESGPQRWHIVSGHSAGTSFVPALLKRSTSCNRRCNKLQQRWHSLCARSAQTLLRRVAESVSGRDRRATRLCCSAAAACCNACCSLSQKQLPSVSSRERREPRESSASSECAE
jgi:hypothetical protein